MSHVPKTHRVLLVEDNPDDVFMFMRAMSKAGQRLDVSVAGNAEEAINALGNSTEKSHKGFRPDVLVTDLKMPGWTGIHLVSWTRSQPGFADMPIIVLSSSEEPRDVANAHEAGATAFLVKPNGFSGYTTLVEQIYNFCIDPKHALQSEFLRSPKAH